MNACENWNICPMGDLANIVKCRKAGCPKQTAADVASPIQSFINSGGMRQVVD